MSKTTRDSSIDIPNTDLFHVHTYRCQHAEMISDEEYVKTAIEMGATGIWFTDHAPFPSDRFRNRMKYNELNEYIDAINNLRISYADRINIHLGLEIEYLPEYDKKGYYESLWNDDRIEILVLGQHMAEDLEKQGTYTFDWDKDRLKEEEYKALMDAMITGIETNRFDIVAHPDRCFRRCRKWSHDMSELSRVLINKTVEHNMLLEINMHSVNKRGQYWPEFWEIARDEGGKTVIGLDAHSLEDLRKRKARADLYMDML